MRPKFFLIKTYQKNLTKTHTKPTRKIKHKNKHYKKKKKKEKKRKKKKEKIIYLIDIPILNNTTKKNCLKTHKKKLIHFFKYKDICFYGLIGLILP
jgi:hypothetical protein